MKRLLVLVTLIAALVLLASAFTSAGNKSSALPEYRDGEVLVKFKGGVSDSDGDALVRKMGAEGIRKFRAAGLRHLRLPKDITVEEAVERLSADPNVEYAEPNYVLHAEATPDDSYYSLLWGLHNIGQSVNGSVGTSDADIDAPEAWDTTTGSASVITAVVDSGIDYNHPDLSDNIWTNAGEVEGNGLDDDGNGFVDDVRGWDFMSDDNDPMDDNGHGTHLAGSIAARGNNTAGVAGVNWTAQVMALKFLDSSGTGDAADAISAIEYATEQGADVVNCSFGGNAFSQALKDAIDASSALFVAASGNDGLDNDVIPHYPSGFDSANVLSVAASDQGDNLSSFSNFGATTVDLAAPGSNILSSLPAARATIYTDTFDDNDISDWTLSSAGAWIAETGALSDGAGDYSAGASKWARQALPLGGEQGCTFGYGLALDTEQGGDFLYVESSTDLVSWITLAAHTGTINAGNFTASLPSSGSSPLYVRFRLAADSDSNVGDGAQINSVAALCASAAYDGAAEYGYEDGTSMSTAVASGVAALIKAAHPSYTAAQIKDLMVDSVDVESSIGNSVASGGRLNAGNAFITAPSGLAANTVSTSRIDLSWTDNSTNESGFVVERKTASTDFSGITQVAAGTTTYSNTGLGEGTTYTFRVRAATSTGRSAPSNEASATTEESSGGGGGGGCFIATAAFGGYSSPEVLVLREFRDRRLQRNPAGRAFVRLYYRLSPPLAAYIASRPLARAAARAALAPVVFGVRHPAWAVAFGALLAAGLCMATARVCGRKDKGA